MKEEKKYIDQLFNETLNGRSFDIPEAFMEDLNKRLDAIEEKKKRGFFWWFILLVGVIGFSFMLVFLTQQSALSGDYQHKASKSGIADITKKQDTELQSSIQQKTIHSDIKKNNSISTTEESGISKITTNFSIVPDKHSTPITDKKQERTNTKRTNRKTDSDLINDYQEKNNSQQAIFAGKTISERSSTVTNNSLIADNSMSEASKSDIQDFLTNDSVLTNLTEKNSLDSVSIHTATDSSTQEMTPSTVQNTSEPILSKIKDRQTTGNWKTEIQLYGGISTLFYRDQSDTSSYAKQLQERQSRVAVPEVGLNGHFSYKDITFGLGINYNQTGEKYTTTINEKFFKDSINYYTTYDTIYYYDSINDIWVMDTVEIQEQYTFQYEDSVLKTIIVKNVYSWVSVPFYFGYRFRAGAFEFIPRVGVQLNFGVARRVGDYPDFISQSIVPFRSKVFSLSYLIQLEIRRNFNDHWHVFVNPSFKSALTPAVSTPAFNRKYTSLGIQFGVGYKF